MAIVLETLSDHLSYHGITKDKACELFGRSPQTIRKWDKSPPPWVLNVLAMVNPRSTIPASWEGFRFYQDRLIMPNGDALTPGQIMSLRLEQLNRHIIATNTDKIRTLKDHLEHQLRKQPVLKISLVDEYSNIEIKNWSIAI